MDNELRGEAVQDIYIVDREFFIDKIYNNVWAEHESLKVLLRDKATPELVEARRAMKEAIYKLGVAKEAIHAE